jgi:hypothetical protein
MPGLHLGLRVIRFVVDFPVGCPVSGFMSRRAGTSTSSQACWWVKTVAFGLGARADLGGDGTLLVAHAVRGGESRLAQLLELEFQVGRQASTILVSEARSSSIFFPGCAFS